VTIAKIAKVAHPRMDGLSPGGEPLLALRDQGPGRLHPIEAPLDAVEARAYADHLLFEAGKSSF
jgi:hypothetical protein